MNNIEKVRTMLVDLRDSVGRHRDMLGQLEPEEQSRMFWSDMAQMKEVIKLLNAAIETQAGT